MVVFSLKHTLTEERFPVWGLKVTKIKLYTIGIA
jgi:hypothetical protein